MMSVSEAERIFKAAGAKKVSLEAKKELVLIVGELAQDIAVRSVEQCAHAGRVTVSKSDIRMATR